MSNNILSAKNSFEGGLVMDFAPDLTPATTLSSALNATLITYNGNEMALLNDMGNGRVETAFLPEGYIPVGTCEFGDIIYIVSYNPLTNKSLIGCFPSPERNISTDEQGLPDQTITVEDFLKLNENGYPTGEIKAMSKKLILSNLISPGDKYRIYTNEDITEEKLSGLNTGNIDEFPQILKIHVVSFKEDGKMDYLDSSIKWYDNGYFILHQEGSTSQNIIVPDIDSYRDLLQSGYSVFQSKVSGKLGLYFELEAITGFSCTHDIKVSETDEGKKYDVYFNYSWTNNNQFVNPSYIVFGESGFETESFEFFSNLGLTISKPELEEITITNIYDISNVKKELYDELKSLYSEGKIKYETLEYEIDKIKKEDNLYIYDSEVINLYEDNIVNNLKQSVYKRAFNITLPYYEGAIPDLTYKYKVIPAMCYGKLEQLAIENKIEFGKIGTGIPENPINTWKYYNTETLSTLTLGLDIYPEPRHIVKQVGLSFYDNEGFKGAYLISGKTSYSGTFTEIIPLNNSIPSYKLTSCYNYEGNFVECNADYNPDTLNTVASTFVKLQDGENTLFSEKYSSNYILLSDYRKVLNEKLNEQNLTETEDITKYKQDFAENNLTLNNSYYYTLTNALIESNKLYLVKITIEYEKEIGGNSSTHKQYYRWFWSNNMFNASYYTTNDFSILQPVLLFDCNASYTGNNINPKETSFDNTIEQKIDKYVINTSILVGFLNNYNTFNLYHKYENGKFSESDTGALDTITIILSIPNKGIIKYNPENPEYKSFNGTTYNGTENLYPSYNEEYIEINSEYKDLFKLYFVEKQTVIEKDENDEEIIKEIVVEKILDNEEITYISSFEELSTEYAKQMSYNLKDLYYTTNVSNHILLLLDLEKYHKIYKVYSTTSNILPIIKPIIYNLEDLNNYNISHYDNHFYINNLYVIAAQLNKTNDTRISNLKFDETKTPIKSIGGTNTSYRFGLPKDAGGFGYNHYNMIGGNNKLLSDTNDGFYLWAIDHNELNLLTDTNSSEMIIINDNEDYRLYTFNEYVSNEKPLYTKKDRIITWPISPDLHYSGSKTNNYIYDFLRNDTKLSYATNTNCTMVGLALVHDSTWYTLNNVFNLNYDNNYYYQTIRYRENLSKIQEEVEYIITDLGEEFDYLNEKNDSPGYMLVELSDDLWKLITKDKYFQIDGCIYTFSSEDILLNNITSVNIKYINHHAYTDEIKDISTPTLQNILSLEVSATIVENNSENIVNLTISTTGSKYTFNEGTYEITNLTFQENNCVIVPHNMIIIKNNDVYTILSGETYTLYINIKNEGIKSTDFNIIKNSTTDEYLQYPVTPGDAIVALLNQIYIKTDKTSSIVTTSHTDTVYLDYITEFTKDIVCEISIEKSNINKSISINGILYLEYINTIINKYTDIKIDNTNLDILIGSCKKTLPITFKINKPKIDIPIDVQFANCIVLFEGNSIPKQLNTENNIMYLYVDKELKPLPRAFSYYPIPKYDETLGLVKINTEKNKLHVDNIANAFKIVNDRFTVDTEYHPEDLFLIVLDDTKDKRIMAGIRDIPKRASLFKGTEIL